MITPIVTFSDDMTADQKLEILFKYHNFDNSVKIDEEDKVMVIMALNNVEVTEVKNDDGALVIGYANDEWENE